MPGQSPEVPVPPSSMSGSAQDLGQEEDQEQGASPAQDHDDGRRGGTARGRRAQSDDEFDSEEFRSWLRQKDRRRDRDRRRARRRDDSDESDRGRDRDDKDEGRTNAGPAPEWDGENLSLQDYAIKARLWLATTRAKARTRGPLLLQKLSKTPFESMKFLAKDSTWMSSETNGTDLIDMMDKPDLFGEDRDEDLLGALARVTYHLRRERGEGFRAFFGRWDVAMRKVTEHGVTLPEKYIGFLLINALNLQDNDIKALVSFTQGSILQKDVRAWMRKYVTKLQVSQVGNDKRDKTSRVLLTEDYDDLADDAMELHMMETALRDLRGEDDSSLAEANEDEDQIHALEEHEAAEILATLVQKKRTFMQNAKTKKSVELGRGYRGGPASSTSTSTSTTINRTGLKPGRFKASGKIDMTIEELKKVTKCGICKKPGHWWKECPQRDKEKEAHVLEVPLTKNIESDEALFCGLVEHDQDTPEEHRSSCNRLSREFSEPVDPTEDGHQFSTVGPDLEPAPSVYKVRDHDVLFGELEPVSSGVSDSVEWPVTLRDTPINEDECATIDTGCQRMAVGHETLSRLANRLPEGLSVNLVRQVHRFRSVHGRSSTQHVAALPTSLGPKGSLLRPAVFENEESKQAPFLLSLPFLLFCRTELTLDPEVGLSAYFKRLNFRVPCHLGPSGALRVPLCHFTPQKIARIQEAMQCFEAETKEFEVLKVQDNPDPSHGFPSGQAEPHSAARRGHATLEAPAESSPVSPQAGLRAGHEAAEDAGRRHGGLRAGAPEPESLD